MRKFLSIMKALADETRLRILMALRDGELCACQITAFLNMAPSTVSRHLFLLSHAELIDKRKCGKWIYCSLPSKPSPEVDAVLKIVHKALVKTDTIQRDSKKLSEIKKLTLEQVCEPLNQKRKRKQKQ